MKFSSLTTQRSEGVLYPNLAALPSARAADAPQAACVADERERLTNEQFELRVLSLAYRLFGAGVSTGDVVAIHLPNGVNFVVALFAIWRLGAIATPVNSLCSADELQYQLDDSTAIILIRSDSDGHVKVERLQSREDNASVDALLNVVADSDLALIIYTSGTTGRPKGVMLEHRNLNAMVAMGGSALSISSRDRALLILPLFHVNAIVVSTLMPLSHGGSVFVSYRFSPTTFFELLDREQATFFSGVPTIFAMLLARATAELGPVSSLRFAICGAAPAPPDLLAQFEARFGIPILEGYGLSEATCATTLNPLNGPRKAGTVGLVFGGVSVRIGPPTGDSASLGDIGEVLIMGPTIMRGYLGRPEETAQTIVNGWLRTGDLGTLDADGYLKIVGRSKEMIIRGGENVYPKEVEDALSRHPGVRAAAVIGEPDPVWGERVVAFVESADDRLTEPELKEFAATLLAPYKCPSAITFVQALPRNSIGKVNKPALRLSRIQEPAG